MAMIPKFTQEKYSIRAETRPLKLKYGWKTALSAAQPYLPEHLPAHTKQLNCATAIKNAMAAKA